MLDIMTNPILGGLVTTFAICFGCHNGDREGMRVCLNLSRVEVLNQRYFLGPCPF